MVLKYEVKRAENVATHGTLFQLLLTIAPLSSRFLKNETHPHPTLARLKTLTVLKERKLF